MPENQMETIDVMLDVYSGRVNPSWSLSDREIQELRVLLASSTETRTKESVVRPYLGYVGFAIINPSGMAGIPHRVRVYGGVLEVTERKEESEGPEKAVYYADTHRIESWLLEQAVERGYGETIEKMGGPRLPRSGRERPNPAEATSAGSPPSGWMPVFVVHEGMKTIRGGFWEGKELPPRERLPEGRDVWQRIGTAFPRPHGGWDIRISVVPLDGRMVMRPPEPGEKPDAIPFVGR